MDVKKGILSPFLKLAAAMLKVWDRRSGRYRMDPALDRDLRILYPRQELKQVQWEFRVKRLGMALALLCMGILCTIFILLGEVSSETAVSEAGIVRGDYGDGERQVQLEVQCGEYQTQLELAVGARVYSKEDISLLAEEFRQQLPGLILQGNEALDRIQEDLYLAEEYEGFPFLVSWYSGDAQAVDYTGRLVGRISEPRVVQLQALFSYDAMEWEQLLEVTLLPIDVSEGEMQRLMEEELRDYLVQSEQATRSGEYWELPTHWKEQALTYHMSESYLWPVLLVLFAVASVLVFVFARKDLHQKYLDRQLELKEDYPELLHQLTLYLGAGLTIRGSLQKIGSAYEQLAASGVPARAAFEEVEYVCRELVTGVSEVQAYENWSRRTGLAEYTQLCTLLIQNLQKGSTRLVQRLQEEGDYARKEYLRLCKKKSEEAQTRLLLPLVLMLVVVMLLILIPAFSMTGI